MPIETKPTSLLLIEGREALGRDYDIAIGVLSALENELVQQVAQRLFDACPLLEALLEVGWRHLDEVHAIVEAKTQPAADEPDADEPDAAELAATLRKAGL
jgi:hypothetical protein